jgi:hypothetical protein
MLDSALYPITRLMSSLMGPLDPHERHKRRHFSPFSAQFLTLQPIFFLALISLFSVVSWSDHRQTQTLFSFPLLQHKTFFLSFFVDFHIGSPLSLSPQQQKMKFSMTFVTAAMW